MKNWQKNLEKIILKKIITPSVPSDLVGLTTFDPWVGFLKFRWLDILKFEVLADLLCRFPLTTFSKKKKKKKI
jgi:hypothetical protein